MAHYDLQEQDQISNLKYIWNRGGKYIVFIFIILFLAYVIFEIMSFYQKDKSIKSAFIYDSFMKAKEKNMPSDMNKYSLILQNDFKSTEYATIVTLDYAKYLVDKKKLALAENQLSWVVNNSIDTGLINIAKLNLINVLIDENKIAKAKQILNTTNGQHLTPLLYIKRGDLYVIMNNFVNAKKDYDQAKKDSKNSQEIAQLLQLRTMILPN